MIYDEEILRSQCSTPTLSAAKPTPPYEQKNIIYKFGDAALAAFFSK